MKRRSFVIGVGSGLTAFSGCLSSAGPSERTENSDPTTTDIADQSLDNPIWPTVLGNPARTAHIKGNNGPVSGGVVNWGQRLDSVESSSPSVADNTVYIVAAQDSTCDAPECDPVPKGGLYALSKLDGHVKWVFEPGLAFYDASPTVQGNRVFLSDQQSVRSIDTNSGDQVWETLVGNRGGGYNTPIVENGKLYTADKSNGVYALSATDGTVEWTSATWGTNPSLTTTERPTEVKTNQPQTPESVGGGPNYSSIGALALSGDVLFVSGNRNDVGGLFAFDKSSGAQLWQVSFEKVMGAGPTVGSNAVFVPIRSDVSGASLAAVSLDRNEVQWKVSIGQDLSVSPALYDGTLFLGAGSTDQSDGAGVLKAISAKDGSVKWAHTTPEKLTSPPAVASETVYIGDSNGTLHAVSTAGVERWTLKIGDGPIHSAPAIVDGIVFVGSQSGDVVAITEPTT